MSIQEENGPAGTVEDPREVESTSVPTRSGPVFNVWTVGWLALGVLGAMTIFVLQATSSCVDEEPLVDSTAEQAAWPLLFGASICFGAAFTVASRSFLYGLLASVGSFVLILFVALFIGYEYCSPKGPGTTGQALQAPWLR